MLMMRGLLIDDCLVVFDFWALTVMPGGLGHLRAHYGCILWDLPIMHQIWSDLQKCVPLYSMTHGMIIQMRAEWW